MAGPAPGLRVLLEINRHLNIKCHQCDRVRRLSAVEAVEAFGPDTTILEVPPRARCSICGARGRDGFISAWPCTLDQSAWDARTSHASAEARGESLPWSLEESLATYRKLLGDTGELGGDGPVQWPIEPPPTGL